MGYNSKKKFYINDDEEEYKLQSHSREKKKGNELFAEDEYFSFVAEKEKQNKRRQNKEEGI